MKNKTFNTGRFIVVTLITSIWIHVGETARAMFVAFPRMEAFFGDKVQLIGMEQMQIGNALVWGLWDTIIAAVLVFIFWLCAVAFGNNRKSIFVAGTVTAFATIGVFWIATVNSGLGLRSSALLIFPLAWIELIIGSLDCIKTVRS